MADYYISSSTGSNTTGDGSQGNPWGMFKGKCDGNYFLQPGDNVYFKRGDIWLASSAEVVVNSSGNSINQINLGAYGTGSAPLFCGADTTTLGWIATGISSIYSLTGQTQTHLKVVTQGTAGLGRWQGTTSNLAEGTFIRSGSILYVHLWNNANPATEQVRVANFSHSSSADGARGLISTSRINGTQGSYVSITSLNIICANGVGFSASGKNNFFYDCSIIGAGVDGVLFYSEVAGSGENADGGRWYRGDISWSAASGTGFGQGWTCYAPRVWVVDAYVHDNFMAGVDFLDFGANSSVSSSGALRCTVINNARWQDSNSFDPQLYIDGARDIFVYGCNVGLGGVQPGATNEKASIAIGSEHPDTKRTQNVYVINNLIHNASYDAFRTDNANVSTSNILNIQLCNNTIISRLEDAFAMCAFWGDLAPTSGTFRMRNNIFVVGSSGTQRVNLYSDTSNVVSSDFNIFWKMDMSTTLFSTNGGGANQSFEVWKSSTGQDSASSNSSPNIVLVTGNSPNVHLNTGSIAIGMGTPNPYTAPAWLPADLFPYGTGVRGVAQANGTWDYGVTSLDLGFHYLSGEAEPSSSGTVRTKFMLNAGVKVTIGNGTLKLAV